jgi:hypothetical protein
MTCPECGDTKLSLREAESSPAIKWFTCGNGHRFFHKTAIGKAAELSGITIAAVVVTRLLLDHGDFLDIPTDSF